MSFNADRAFDVREGVGVKGGAGFYSGSGSPVGSQANLNSVYRDADSLDVWKKIGPLDTEWELVTAGGSTDTFPVGGASANYEFIPGQCVGGDTA